MLSEVWQGVRRVLAARLDNIGDVVLLSPALRAIKENLPEAAITLLAGPGGAPAAELLPEIDEVLTWRAVWQDVGNRMAFHPEREWAMVKMLRGGQFDAAIIFTSFSQTPYGAAYACYLAGIPLRLGQSKEFGGSLLSIAVASPDDALHQAERNLCLLERSGFAISSRDARVRIPEDAIDSAKAKLARKGIGRDSPYLLIHPIASCAARSYPLDRYGVLGDFLDNQLGMPVVVTAAERERPAMARLIAQMRSRPAVFVGETTVPEWAALIAGSRAVITNNTGALHLADACRTPSVILYSGTDLESQWSPRHSTTRVLRRPTACSPCYRFTCPYHLECLAIQPEEVLAAVRLVLDESEGNRSRVLEGD